MEVPITQFRKNIFTLVSQAAEGAEVWITHKGQRFQIVPENGKADKLSRITPMQVIAPGVDLEDDSWKVEMMQEWEQKWERRLGPASKGPRKASTRQQTSPRRGRRSA
jgi:antitoxin (DNA-binding transcriptional repressor) of toxin-antitoxin stability system